MPGEIYGTSPLVIAYSNMPPLGNIVCGRSTLNGAGMLYAMDALQLHFENAVNIYKVMSL